MVSELATNCIRHTDSGFDLTIIRDGRDIRVEATDHAGGTPTMRSPEPTDASGRGLKIVDMLSVGWGVQSEPSRARPSGSRSRTPRRHRERARNSVDRRRGVLDSCCR